MSETSLPNRSNRRLLAGCFTLLTLGAGTLTLLWMATTVNTQVRIRDQQVSQGRHSWEGAEGRMEERLTARREQLSQLKAARGAWETQQERSRWR